MKKQKKSLKEEVRSSFVLTAMIVFTSVVCFLFGFSELVLNFTVGEPSVYGISLGFILILLAGYGYNLVGEQENKGKSINGRNFRDG